MAKGRVETIGNSRVRFTFDARTGGLTGVRNLTTGNECLGGAGGPGNPFCVYSDFRREFEITGPEGKTPHEAVLPRDIAGESLEPAGASATFARSRKADAETLKITYTHAGLPWIATLTVRVSRGSAGSLWRLKVKNAGTESRDLMASFPLVSGVRLGDGRKNLMVVNDQAGYILPLWSSGGGIYGNSGRMSMQWGCVYDEASGDAFAFIVRDPDVRNKQIRYLKPSIEVSYFPPLTLAPEESADFPDAEILVYDGDWKRAAVAYRDWFSSAFTLVKHARWVRDLDGHGAGWFEKKVQTKAERYPRVDRPIGHFRELPDLYRAIPVDNVEYAFHCSRSMPEEVTGKKMLWTDADCVIRPDLGGAEGLREGVRGVHALGHHFTFYMDAYLCPTDADLALSGRAREWAVTNRDGTNHGNYTAQGEEIGCGFFHMCPGARGFQDYLARSAARLVRETGADGVRIDSLGFYSFPCYNPLHGHESPFDYNLWLREMLAAIAAAVRKVNPDCLLATEGGADFTGEHFDGCLSQQWVRHRVAVTRGVSPMRIACPDYIVLMHIPCGPVAASLSGLPGGSASLLGTPARMVELDLKWRGVRFAAAEVMRWGEAANDDPTADRPGVECRRFSAGGVEAIVGARPVFPVAGADGVAMNSNIDVRRAAIPLTVSFAGVKGRPRTAFLYDVEKLAVTELAVSAGKGVTSFEARSNWFLAILSYGKPTPLALLDLPTVVRRGVRLSVRSTLLGAGKSESFEARLFAPVFGVGTPKRVVVPGTIELSVSAATPPGRYVVELSSKGFFGYRRFITVTE